MMRDTSPAGNTGSCASLRRVARLHDRLGAQLGCGGLWQGSRRMYY
jgi:hypothetical protein